MNNYEITILELKDNINAEKLVSYNQFSCVKKTSVATKGLYDCCSIFFYDENNQILTHFDDTKKYLDSLLRKVTLEYNINSAYIFGGQLEHMINILDALKSFDISVSGGYVDYYSGWDLDIGKSYYDELRVNILRDVLKNQDNSGIIENNLYNLQKTAAPFARKDLEIFSKDKKINLYLSKEQYHNYYS